MSIKKIVINLCLCLLILNLWIQPAFAFCGFYVAKADSKLYNQASQVIIAKDGNKTILTMANDYQGNVQDFALVVPVPVVLQEEQVHIGDSNVLEHLDAFSAPRLVEYFDQNPCNVYEYDGGFGGGVRGNSDDLMMLEREDTESALGVTIESRFSVGEYDILILSAKESDGLETWLNQNGYKIPTGASAILQPYIRQQMKFFVAKVNLEKFDQTGFNKLRPLQMAYESPKFMLPIRLGMVNAQGAQDLIVYLLSPQGQIELTNYRSVKIPSDAGIPEFVQQEFPDFYKSMFQKIYVQENQNVAFLEYAWDMSWCDPCAAEPLSQEELEKAGVFWLTPEQSNNVFLTRLHVRYTRDKFAEDLRFQETPNRENFQGRYIITHPYRDKIECNAANSYLETARQKQEQEAQTLANLTGWDVNTIRNKIKFVKIESSQPWWRRIFN